MPLVQATLAALLGKVFASKPRSAATAAAGMADAYDSYAQAAVAMTAVPCPLVAPGNKAAIEAALAAALAPSQVSRFGGAWAQALPAYWLAAKFVGPPIAPATAPTASVALLFPGAAGTLASCGAAQPPSPILAANAIAAALHLATIGGVVTFATAPPGVLV